MNMQKTIKSISIDKTDFRKLVKHNPKLNFSLFVRNAIDKELNQGIQEYKPKNAILQVKTTDPSGSVKISVFMDNLPESAVDYLEKMARQIQDYLKQECTE
jgi:hypothetical protein